MIPNRKFSLSEIGSIEEEIYYSKKQMQKPLTITQKTKGGDNLSHAQLEGIRTYLENIESLIKRLDQKIDSLELKK